MINNEVEITLRGVEDDVWTAYRRIGNIMRIVGHMPAIPNPADPGQIIMVVSVLLPTDSEALTAEASTLDR